MKNDVEKMLNININFHQLIYTASHNRMLKHVLGSYQLYLRHIRKTPENTKEYLARVLDEHRVIFEAFKNKDVEAGVAAMATHMDNSFRRSYNK